MFKFALQILFISLITLLVTALIAFHVGLAVYLLATIALVNYENLEVE